MNNANGRLVYDNAVRALYRAFPTAKVGQFKTTQSYIRLEQTVAVGQTLYTFPLLTNQAAANNTEERLNLQDSFVTSQIGFYLAKPISATDSTFRLNSQPSQFVFTNAAQYQNFYNGKLAISVNNNTILPSWDLARHYYAAETQQTAAFAATSPIDQLKLDEDSMYAVEPNIVLVGSKNYQITVSIPTGLTAVDSAFTRIVLIFRGILAQNSTVVS